MSLDYYGKKQGIIENTSKVGKASAEATKEKLTEEEYKQDGLDKLFPIDFAGVYAGMAADAIGESYCSTDSCEIKLIKDNITH
jgi:hypothetical protein